MPHVALTQTGVMPEPELAYPAQHWKLPPPDQKEYVSPFIMP